MLLRERRRAAVAVVVAAVGVAVRVEMVVKGLFVLIGFGSSS